MTDAQNTDPRTTVFVLVGNNDEQYEQYHETVLGVFLNQVDAETAGTDAKAFTDEYRGRWAAWVAVGGPSGQSPNWLDETRPYVAGFAVEEVPLNGMRRVLWHE